jgi:hypothetical protein
MCLYKDKKHHPFNHPLIAEKDIVCYKQLCVNWNNAIVTPITKTLIPIKCIHKNKKKRVPFKAEILNKFRFIWGHVLGFSDEVTDGFIHTFSSNPLHYNYFLDGHVFKCVIPKGTKYFIGNDGDYASEQIIFVEQLK